ncbi:hypothetical protein SMB554_20570 (plasmid) [Sinorhizobium meliloti]|nr:hypothetical protein SMB554_20570 [Sinorhizobium meliloti]
MRRLRSEGMNFSKIAEAVGIQPNAVRYHLRWVDVSAPPFAFQQHMHTAVAVSRAFRKSHNLTDTAFQ